MFVVEVLAETGGLRGTTIGSYANTHREPAAADGLHPPPALRRSSNRKNKRSRASQSTTKNDRRLSCELTSAGTFGKTSNENLHFVSFYYQVEFVSGTTLLEVASELLPLLEESITEGILPSLFECPDTTPKGSAAGLSISFDDTVTSSVPCVRVVEGECLSFQGRIILFGNDFSSQVEAQLLIRDVVRDFILTSSTDLSALDTRIEGMSYVFSDNGRWVAAVLPSSKPSTTPTLSPTLVPTTAVPLVSPRL